MESLAETGKCGAINAADPTTMGYQVVKYVSDDFTFQKKITTDRQVSKEGELLVRSEHPIITKEKNWYWKQNTNKHNVTIPTFTIVHTCIYVSVIKGLEYTPGSIFSKKTLWKYQQQQPIFITDTDHDYKLDEIMRRDHIE